jgi:dolichol kinase
MKYEISRQIIHIAGLVFIVISQFTGSYTASLLFFIISLGFFIYSEFINKGHIIVSRIRRTVLKMDRNASKPLIGAFWFYFALGMIFLIFPIGIATVAGIILCVSDSLSTLVGIRYGRHKIIGNKSLEGSIVFFLSTFIITAISLDYIIPVSDQLVMSLTIFIISIAVTFVELVPEAKIIRKWKRKEIVDDNWLIPLFSGLVIYAAYILTIF